MGKAISGASRALFGGQVSESQQSSNSSSALDPRVFALMTQNYDYAKNVASGLGARSFAGFSGLQNQALNQLGGLNNGFSPDAMASANAALTQRATRPFLGGEIAQYQNPYTSQVIDQSMMDIDRQRMLAQQGVNAQALSRGAYGGSRQAIAEAENNRNYADTFARTSAGLRAQGYESALNAAQQDRNSALQNYQMMNQSFLGNLQAQMQGGGLQQQLEQQRLDAARNLPLEQLQIRSGALGLNPFGGAGNVSQGSSQGTSYSSNDKGLFGWIPGLS
jgi:hypothetical protein